ncbi:hypothetical protein [Paenibacillus sp. OV219]|nr:hypothetical protein [Paenibacillus sp. OV219]
MDGMIRLLTANETIVNSGDTVYMRIRGDKFHLFDETNNGSNLMQYR